MNPFIRLGIINLGKIIGNDKPVKAGVFFPVANSNDVLSLGKIKNDGISVGFVIGLAAGAAIGNPIPFPPVVFLDVPNHVRVAIHTDKE